jgi:hypothetical protein
VQYAAEYDKERAEIIYEYHAWLGPMLVLGPAFPSSENPVAPGSRLAPRPRVSFIRGGVIDDRAVAAVVQWCISSRFRPAPCNVYGGRTRSG